MQQESRDDRPESVGEAGGFIVSFTVTSLVNVLALFLGTPRLDDFEFEDISKQFLHFLHETKKFVSCLTLSWNENNI